MRGFLFRFRQSKIIMLTYDKGRVLGGRSIKWLEMRVGGHV